MKVIILLIIITCLSGFTSFAQNESPKSNQVFYSGNIYINKVSGKISLYENKEPEISMELQLLNKENKMEDFSIGFRQGIAVRDKIDKSGTLNLKPAFTIDNKKGIVQKIEIDLTPLINNQIPAQTIGSLEFQVNLPENYMLIRANKPFKLSKSDHGTTLLFNERNKYLTPLVLVYNTSGMGVSIEKTVTSGKISKGPVTFKLKIVNTGKKELYNILMEDNFDPRDFSASGTEFSDYKGDVNDSRIIWKKNIPFLKPGESTELSYTLNANFEVKDVSLNSTKATVDKNILIGVSNKISL